MARFRAARFDRWFDRETMRWRVTRVVEAFGDSREEAKRRIGPLDGVEEGRQVRIVCGPVEQPLPSVELLFSDTSTPAGRVRDRLARTDPNLFAPRDGR